MTTLESRRDLWLLFATRALRMFAFGGLSVVLVFYLRAIGLSDEQVGWLLALTLFGDTLVSLLITSVADRVGRRRMLMVGAVLMAAAGAVFVLTREFVWLVIAAAVGVISPSDKEVGPFQSIEQASLSQSVPDDQRTTLFAWYMLVGSVSAALGSLCGGWIAEAKTRWGATGPQIYQPLVVGYAATGVLLAFVFLGLSRAIEPPALATHEPRGWLGLSRSRPVVIRLSALFALDAFGGGFIVQSILAYWVHRRFQLDLAQLGALFFVANLLAAASSLVAARLAKRIGLIQTMVFTHLPSNVLLVLVPLMPNGEWAVALLLVRFSISQMDVPTRQSYTMSVVPAEERAAAAGVTAVARSIGSAVSPMLAGYCLARPELFDAPLFIAGGVKIVYDLWLFAAFRSPTPEPRS